MQSRPEAQNSQHVHLQRNNNNKKQAQSFKQSKYIFGDRYVKSSAVKINV